MNQLTVARHSSQLHSALQACWVTLSAGDSATAAHANCINASVLLHTQHLWLQLEFVSLINVLNNKTMRAVRGYRSRQDQRI